MTVFLEPNPLIRKLWIPLGPKFTETMAEDMLATHLAGNRDMSELHVNIVLGDTHHTNLNKLRRIISLVRRFRIGEERSLPTICVCVPYLQVHQGFANVINGLDKYSPAINLFLMIGETDILDNRRLLENVATVSHILFERVINFRYLLFLERNVGILEQMTQLTSAFALQQRENKVDAPTYPPIFEISPRIRIDDHAFIVRSLLTLHIEYPEVFEFVTMGPCGFSTLFFRTKEMYLLGQQIDLGSLPIPLFPCGADKTPGLQESNHPNYPNGSTGRYCFYKLLGSAAAKSKSATKCTHCPLVDHCMGCPVGASDNNGCQLYPFVDVLLTELKRRPSLLEQLQIPKPKIGILELDWDYIYDSFEDLGFRREDLH